MNDSEADPGGNLGTEHELTALGFLAVLLHGESLSTGVGGDRSQKAVKGQNN